MPKVSESLCLDLGDQVFRTIKTLCPNAVDGITPTEADLFILGEKVLELVKKPAVLHGDPDQYLMGL